MRIAAISSAFVFFLLVAGAQAHTHLRKSIPANGSVVTAAPPAVVLSFSEAARITAAWIQKKEGDKQKLGPLPDKAAAQVTIPLPALTPGSYVVTWRAASDDGHVMPGELRFTLSAAAKDSAQH